MMLRAVVWVAAVAMVRAYPNGPPIDKYGLCESMDPFGHNATAKTSPPPFEFVIEGDCYKANMDVNVRIRVKPGADTEYYEGLFVQARVPNGNTQSVGMFNVADESTLQPLSCPGGTSNSFGQNKKEHFTCHTYQWKAPASFTQDIQFRATMVHETDEFWVNVLSDTLPHRANCQSRPAVACETPSSGIKPSYQPLVALCLMLGAYLLRL